MELGSTFGIPGRCVKPEYKGGQTGRMRRKESRIKYAHTTSSSSIKEDDNNHNNNCSCI